MSILLESFTVSLITLRISSPTSQSYFPPAVHLSVHYLKLNQRVGDLKSLILIGSVGKKSCFSSLSPKVNTGIFWSSVVDGYTRWTSLHGFEARHFRDYEITSFSPWTTGHSHRCYPSLLRWCDCLQSSRWYVHCSTLTKFSIDTAIVPFAAKVVLAGIPLTPVPRIAGAIFHAASNPDPETNGCAWLLLDNGPLFRVKPDEFKQGVYGMIDDRANGSLKWVKLLSWSSTYWVTVSCRSD